MYISFSFVSVFCFMFLLAFGMVWYDVVVCLCVLCFLFVGVWCGVVWYDLILFVCVF